MKICKWRKIFILSKATQFFAVNFCKSCTWVAVRIFPLYKWKALNNAYDKKKLRKFELKNSLYFSEILSKWKIGEFSANIFRRDLNIHRHLIHLTCLLKYTVNSTLPQFLLAELPGAPYRRCRATATLGESPDGHDGHEARSSLEAAHNAGPKDRCLHGLSALCPLPSNTATGAQRGRDGRGSDATATAATAAAAAATDAGPATQQHRKLTNNGGDSPTRVRDSGRRDAIVAVSGSESGPQDRTARTPSGTQAGSRL